MTHKKDKVPLEKLEGMTPRQKAKELRRKKEQAIQAAVALANKRTTAKQKEDAEKAEEAKKRAEARAEALEKYRMELAHKERLAAADRAEAARAERRANPEKFRPQPAVKHEYKERKGLLGKKEVTLAYSDDRKADLDRINREKIEKIQRKAEFKAAKREAKGPSFLSKVVTAVKNRNNHLDRPKAPIESPENIANEKGGKKEGLGTRVLKSLRLREGQE